MKHVHKYYKCHHYVKYIIALDFDQYSPLFYWFMTMFKKYTHPKNKTWYDFPWGCFLPTPPSLPPLRVVAAPVMREWGKDILAGPGGNNAT